MFYIKQDRHVRRAEREHRLPGEIDHFLAMIKKAARRIEPDQIEQIGKGLKEVAERSKGS